MRIWLFCGALAACGGIIDTGDGGITGVDSGNGGTDGGVIKKDGSTTDVVLPPTCTPIQSETAIDSNGGCQSSASWSCGNTKYSVQCNCPSTQCTCSEEDGNGTGTGTILKEPSFCPKCDAAQMPKICGFPTN